MTLLPVGAHFCRCRNSGAAVQAAMDMDHRHRRLAQLRNELGELDTPGGAPLQWVHLSGTLCWLLVTMEPLLNTVLTLADELQC